MPHVYVDVSRLMGVHASAVTTLDEIAVYTYKFRKGCHSVSTQGYAPKIPSGMHVRLTTTFSKIAEYTKQHCIHIPMQTRT